VTGNGTYRVGTGFEHDVGSFGNGSGCIDNVVYQYSEMVFTDSIPYSKKCVKVKQLSIADMFAETIKR